MLSIPQRKTTGTHDSPQKAQGPEKGIGNFSAFLSQLGLLPQRCVFCYPAP